MNRRHVTFACAGATLVGSLDEAPGTTGLLIVSGGNEIRSGSWAGQAQLAMRIAAAGFPVFRFDRRGVGDSGGDNHGFHASLPDTAAAMLAFRDAAPQLQRVVAFGNCDAASALAINAAALMLDGLVLANPWVIDGDDTSDVMPASAIRNRYLAKLRNPREVLRLLTGGVNLAKLVRGLKGAVGSAPAPSPLAEQMRQGLAAFQRPVAILLAEHDRTAQLFTQAWPKDDPRIARIASRSHSFSDDAAREWLFERLLAALD